MTIPKKIIEKVENRAQGFCEFCGFRSQESMALHHRKLKSRGGKDTVSNLVWVHHKCHNLGTDSIHLNPEMATKKGFMVSAWREPSDVPIQLPSGNFALLSEDGEITHLGEANELNNC